MRADGARSANVQGGYQLAALGTTLAISIFGGLLVGWFLRSSVFDKYYVMFSDDEYFECEEEEEHQHKLE